MMRQATFWSKRTRLNFHLKKLNSSLFNEEAILTNPSSIFPITMQMKAQHYLHLYFKYIQTFSSGCLENDKSVILQNSDTNV